MSTEEIETERLLNIDQVAKLLGVSTSWVREHVELPRVKLGKSTRFSPRVVRQFIRERTVGGKA